MIYIKEIQPQEGMQRTEYNRLLSRTAHNMLKEIAFDRYGISVTDDIIARGEHGKPYIINSGNIHFNISHCTGACAIVFSDKPVGLDIEHTRRISPSLAPHVCSRTELDFLSASNDFTKDFLRLWTLKESFVKATGEGLYHPLKNIVFDISGAEVLCSNKDFKFSQYIIKDFVVSLCYHADDASAPEGGYIII